MSAIKTGPNLVVHFGLRGRAQRLRGRLHEHPGALAARPLAAHAHRPRAAAPIPGPIGVLQRCLVLNQNLIGCRSARLDLVLPVPELAGATLLDFDRHFEVFEGAYQWCKRRIDELGEQSDAALAAILATRD